MTTSLTPESAAALDGPRWLTERRAAAAARAAETAPPSASDEVWRYSRIAELDLDAFHPATPADGVPPEVEALLATLGSAAATVVLRNGWLVRCDISADAAAAGLSIRPLADLDEADAPDVPVARDLFGHLAVAHAPAPLRVDLPAGATVDAPVVVVQWVDEADAAVFTTVEVRIGADAELRLLEWQGSAEVVAFSAPTTSVHLERGARASHVVVQDHAPSVWQIAEVSSGVGQDATLTAAHAGLGGDYARCRTDCRLEGRGASGTLLALYFGEGSQTLDYRTFQEHLAPDTTSDLLYKGAVGDTSRSVYSGLIRVAKEARGTNAFQTNRNIKLSDGAWAESVPNLEIENNDVRCSHASTVGPIDDDQRFYLESRGVPPLVAQRLVVGGFFREVLSRLPVAGVAPLLETALASRLARVEDPIDGDDADGDEGGAR